MAHADQASRLCARIFSNDRCDRHSGVFFSHSKTLYSKMKRLFSCSWQKRYMNKFVNVFSFAQPLPIAFLDTKSSEQLLVDPLREQNIEIHPNTVALALKLTGGNPYYMTLIGQQLIHYLNKEIHQQLITDVDLRVVTEQLIEKGASQNS